jgi:single-strand DNA-binding protein
MNNITILGNLTRDCEVKQIKDGLNVIKFAIADNRRKDEVTFWDCEQMSGDKGLGVVDYLEKGKKVCVVGEVRTDVWADKETGEPRNKMIVDVRHITLAG